MAQSRLARRSIKQSKHQLYVSLIGIVIVIFLAINFGPVFIGVSGGLIDKIAGKTGQNAAIKSDAQIQPPTLDPLPEATPSAHIDVTGKTDYPEGRVELYVNDSLADEKDVDSSQAFQFEHVLLHEGNNTLKTRMIVNDKKSDFSDSENVSYSKSAPKLDVSFPTDKQTFTKADQQITITGSTDPENSVTVNGFVAIVDSQGNFSYDYHLNTGDNKLAIIATGASGATTEKDITVSYSE